MDTVLQVAAALGLGSCLTLLLKQRLSRHRSSWLLIVRAGWKKQEFGPFGTRKRAFSVQRQVASAAAKQGVLLNYEIQQHRLPPDGPAYVAGVHRLTAEEQQAWLESGN